MVIKTKYTKELLEEVVNKSRSVAGTLKNLGLTVSGGNYRYISSLIRYYGISTSHFEGQHWARGKTKTTDEGIARNVCSNMRHNKDIFVENAFPIQGGRLGRRLIDLGWEYCCAICGLREWRGKSIVFHIDHINGIRNDNRFENLRFLCPNCHQQTETWGRPKDIIEEISDICK